MHFNKVSMAVLTRRRLLGKGSDMMCDQWSRFGRKSRLPSSKIPRKAEMGGIMMFLILQIILKDLDQVHDGSQLNDIYFLFHHFHQLKVDGMLKSIHT
jgi:hypothetical protein